MKARIAIHAIHFIIKIMRAKRNILNLLYRQHTIKFVLITLTLFICVEKRIKVRFVLCTIYFDFNFHSLFCSETESNETMLRMILS